MRWINPGHLYKALRHTLAGLRRAWGEQAFRHEVLLFPALVLGLVLARPGLVWCGLLLGAWFLVLAVELLNSALEELSDLVSPEYNLHIKYAKDMASAAVGVLLGANALLWALMLWDAAG